MKIIKVDIEKIENYLLELHMKTHSITSSTDLVNRTYQIENILRLIKKFEVKDERNSFKDETNSINHN